jgi:hypothetical protein
MVIYLVFSMVSVSDRVSISADAVCALLGAIQVENECVQCACISKEAWEDHCAMRVQRRPLADLPVDLGW